MLIKAADNVHSDPDTDERCCWKKNDIVVIMEDGHPWGSKEGPPKFYVVSLPGIPKANVMPYCQCWQTDPADPDSLQRRSKYWWDNATQEFVDKETGTRTHKDTI
jgi:hypothetical protein